jgi:hypothetical protein
VSSFWLDDDRASFTAKSNDVSLPNSDQLCCNFHTPYPVGAESSVRKLGVRNGPLICCLVSRLKISVVKSSIFHSPYRSKSFSEMSRRLWGPTSLPFSGYWRSFPVVKRAEPDVDQWPTSVANLKTEWNILLIPPICLHGIDRDGL